MKSQVFLGFAFAGEVLEAVGGQAPSLVGMRIVAESAMAFANRSDAGQMLAAALAKYKDQQPVILALPRGGVPVASKVAPALNAPLDLILVRKIGVPTQPELAMGAVVNDGAPIVVRNEDVIRLGSRQRVEVTGRTAIVIDDGVATGATTRAALRAIRMRNPKRLVLAVPVACTDNLVALRADADDVICLEDHEFFGAIGYYYRDFRQVSDEEVIKILARFPVQMPKRERQPAT